MMKCKKIISLILCAAMVMSFAACKEETASKKETASKPSDSSEVTPSGDSLDDPQLKVDSEASSEQPSVIPTDSDSDSTDSNSGGGTESPDTQTENTVKYKMKLSNDARVYLSNSKTTFLRQENAFKLYSKKDLDTSSGLIVEFDGNDTAQEIEGFGGAMTDTSAVVLSGLPEKTRNMLMTKLFDNNKGIGLSMIRGCIGASDFTPAYYTYDDMPEGEEDWDLEHFDISHDQKQIIPLMKQAMSINNNIKVMLSPWTPPLWMKTTYNWLGSSGAMLRLDCYDVYAKYLVKTVQAYESSGIPIYAMTIQNEPQGRVGWPGCIWDGDQMADFISLYLRPEMDTNNIKSKLWIWDHNYADYIFPLTILAQCKDDIDGIAWHWYDGTPEQMREVSDYYDDIPMYITENGTAVQSFARQLLEMASGCVRALRTGARNYITWNFALNMSGGPTYNNVNNGCSGIIRVNETGEDIQYTAEFYGFAHFSKFIHVGAKVVNSTDTGYDTNYQQCNLITRNPNGSMTAVLVNNEKTEKVFKLVMGDQVMEVPISGRSVITVTWDANA